MSEAYLNNYLNNLTQQISVSVEHLKYKSSSLGKSKTDAIEEEGSSSSNYSQSLHNYSYNLLASNVSYDLRDYNSQSQQQPNRTHAINSYNQAQSVNQEPKVLLEYMHKFNQIFDFRV